VTPWPRSLRTACLLLVLTAGAVQPPAYAADHAPRTDESRAGSRYGEGRERPGRAEPQTPETVPSYPAEHPPADPSHDTALPPSPTLPPPAAEPGLRVVPLGSGLILVGLGLGMAFVGLRVRRGG